MGYGYRRTKPELVTFGIILVFPIVIMIICRIVMGIGFA